MLNTVLKLSLNLTTPILVGKAPLSNLTKFDDDAFDDSRCFVYSFQLFPFRMKIENQSLENLENLGGSIPTITRLYIPWRRFSHNITVTFCSAFRDSSSYLSLVQEQNKMRDLKRTTLNNNYNFNELSISSSRIILFRCKCKMGVFTAYEEHEWRIV